MSFAAIHLLLRATSQGRRPVVAAGSGPCVAGQRPCSIADGQSA